MSKSVPRVSGSGSGSCRPFSCGPANPRGELVGLPLCPRPVAVFEGPSEPAPVLPPLDLVEARFRIREHPDPVAAPFSGAVSAPTTFRACHHFIPHRMMDCTICVLERSRGPGSSASDASAGALSGQVPAGDPGRVGPPGVGGSCRRGPGDRDDPASNRSPWPLRRATEWSRPAQRIPDRGVHGR